MHLKLRGAVPRPSIQVFFKGLTLLVTMTLLPTFLHAAEPTSVKLQFEREGLDLDTGAVIDLDPLVASSEESDLTIGYHADRSPHATLVPSTGTEITLMLGTAMEDVTVDDITGAIFSPEAQDAAFNNGSSALVKTAENSVFLIGIAHEADESVSFHYMRVE